MKKAIIMLVTVIGSVSFGYIYHKAFDNNFNHKYCIIPFESISSCGGCLFVNMFDYVIASCTMEIYGDRSISVDYTTKGNRCHRANNYDRREN